MSYTRLATAAFAALVLTAPLGAQAVSATGTPSDATLRLAPIVVVAPEVTPVVTNAATERGSLTPTLAGAAFRVRADATELPLNPAPAPAATTRNTALMVVGGAAMIVGAIVGGRSGNIIMIGGGAVGLVGLWGYLN